MPNVEIRGNSDLRKALQRFAPDLEAALRKEMRRGLDPVVRKARSFVPSQSPMSHWEGGYSKKINAKTSMFRVGKFPLYNPTIIKEGIKLSTVVSKPNKNGFTSNARIMNQSQVGAIYETAGRKNPQGQPWTGKGGSSHRQSHARWSGAGAQFISNLPALVESKEGTGRLIYRAWAEDQGVAVGIVNKAVSEATDKFYTRNAYTAFKKVA
jgi:hypothetical protein